jgi:hypothetical protein
MPKGERRRWEDFFAPDSRGKINYRLKKTLFMVEGLEIGASYSASWEDARTGLAMLGRGAGFWRYRDGKLQLWDAAMPRLRVVERFASASGVSSTDVRSIGLPMRSQFDEVPLADESQSLVTDWGSSGCRASSRSRTPLPSIANL